MHLLGIMIFTFIFLLMVVSGGIQLQKSEISLFISTCKLGAYDLLIFSGDLGFNSVTLI